MISRGTKLNPQSLRTISPPTRTPSFGTDLEQSSSKIQRLYLVWRALTKSEIWTRPWLTWEKNFWEEEWIWMILNREEKGSLNQKRKRIEAVNNSPEIKFIIDNWKCRKLFSLKTEFERWKSKNYNFLQGIPQEPRQKA